MFTTRLLVRQIGRTSQRHVSTTRHSLYDQRRATIAAVGLGACATWWHTRNSIIESVDTSDPVKVHGPVVVYQIVGNQPSAARTKMVEPIQDGNSNTTPKNKVNTIISKAEESVVDKVPLDATETPYKAVIESASHAKKKTHPIISKAEESVPVKVSLVATETPYKAVVEPANHPKRIVGSTYTATKKHVDDDEDEKWFTC